MFGSLPRLQLLCLILLASNETHDLDGASSARTRSTKASCLITRLLDFDMIRPQGGEVDRHIHTHSHTDTQTHRHTDTQTHRHTDTHRHTQTHAHALAHTQHTYTHKLTHTNMTRLTLSSPRALTHVWLAQAKCIGTVILKNSDGAFTSPPFGFVDSEQLQGVNVVVGALGQQAFRLTHVWGCRSPNLSHCCPKLV
jgi:hypothetical protein